MIKANIKNEWKPVIIDGTACNANLDGLLGVEECSDYDLNTILNSKQKRKRNLESILGNDSRKDAAPSKKKKTKKKTNSRTIKKKIKVDSNLLPSETGSTEFSVDVVETLDDIKTLDKPNNMEAWDFVPLPYSILKALSEQKFYQPTPIQSLTLPPAMMGRRDILGAAETGSGKTLAFGIPILTGILKLIEMETVDGLDCSHLNPDVNIESDEELELCDELLGLKEEKNTKKHIKISSFEGDDDVSSESDFEETEEHVEGIDRYGIGCVKSINNIQSQFEIKQGKPLYSLILTPTRELAIQIRNHLVAIAKYTGIHVAVVVGGMAAVKQERLLRKEPEIVVATPGRLWELIEQGNPHLSKVDQVKFLAIDETDRMVERGHFQELHSLLERLNFNEINAAARQNFVFSATLTLVHELPTHLKARKKLNKKISEMTPSQKLEKLVDILGIRNPKVVDITKGTGTSSTLTQSRIVCSFDEKDYYVYYFLQKHPGRTIIFCNSIGCVKRLTTLLGLLGCNCLPLHASMQQRQRLKNLDRFTDNINGILIATDVAARGLDIPSIEHVLHYQTPRTSESYVHRSGRTARASQQGLTVLLVEPEELKNYLKLCRNLKITEDIPLFPINKTMLNAVKERVKLARELDKLELQVKKANSETGWLEKAANDMDIILDEHMSKYEKNESKSYKKQADIKRKQLAQLLSKPVFPKGFSGKYPLSLSDGDILIPNEEKVEKAIDVMKTAIENYSKANKKERRKAKIIFKPKFQNSTETIKLNATTKKKSKKNKGFRKKH